MSFNDNVTLDTSQVSSGGGGGGAPGGMVVGGGLGGIVILILSLIIRAVLGGGGDSTGATSSFDPNQVSAAGDQSPAAFARCKSGADANRDTTCRIIGTVNSVQAFWEAELPRYGKNWQPTRTVIYRGTAPSACGTASNQVGPFYCPLDQRVYIDASFFQILQDQFGSSAGPLAQEYVVAHEYGHALQDQLGLLGQAQKDPQGANSGSVRTELMADCLGGVWANNATTAKDPDTGTPFLKPLSTQDIQDALSAASAVGDDRIQQTSQGRVNPESWTHGSAEARQRWFMTGFSTGDLNQCDTFTPATVE